MKLFTSYYANIKNIPDDYAVIGISNLCPYWLKDDKKPKNFYFVEDNKLAPSKELLADLHMGNITRNEYVIKYIKELKDRFDFTKDDGKPIISFIEDIERRFYDYNAVVFCCYEDPNDFCHRHILAELLRHFGVEIEELPVKPLDKSQKKTPKTESSKSVINKPENNVLF